jgi:CHASE2 domain-containing sensor protein
VKLYFMSTDVIHSFGEHICMIVGCDVVDWIRSCEIRLDILNTMAVAVFLFGTRWGVLLGICCISNRSNNVSNYTRFLCGLALGFMSLLSGVAITTYTTTLGYLLLSFCIGWMITFGTKLYVFFSNIAVAEP